MVSTFQPSPHGDQNVGGALYGVALASVIIALIAVCSRTFVRARIVHALGWDDWIIILAIVSKYSSYYDGLGDRALNSKMSGTSLDSNGH